MTARSLTAAEAKPFSVSNLGKYTSEAREILALAIPITGGSLVNMGMSITDTVMMGWMGSGALAAGAIVSDIYSIVFYFMAGIVSIVSPLVAQAMGARHLADARRAIHHGIAAACIFAAPAFAAVRFSPEFITIFNVDPGVVSMGRDYAHAMAFTVVPMLFVAVWRNTFDAIGRPRVYLVAILLALPLNAGANQVLMFGWGPIPALGLAGAGIASALVAFTLFAGLVAFTSLNVEVKALRLFAGAIRIKSVLLGEILRLGLPIAFFTVGEVGIFLLATVVASLFGVEALAAHAVTLRVAGVIYAIPVGLSQAATVRVGHAIGGADAAQLERTIISARGVGAISGVLILCALFSASCVLPEYADDGGTRPIVAMVASMLVLLGVLNFAQGFAAPATAVLRAFKETRTPTLICLVGYWLVGMPIAILVAFPFGEGAWGIWVGLASGVVANALLMNLHLARRLKSS